MRAFVHGFFGSAISLCTGAEMTGEAPYFPYSWIELGAALAVAWAIAATIMHHGSVSAVWNKRILPVFGPRARFRLLSPMIDSVRRAILEDNENPASVADLRMSPATTSEVKKLMYRLSKLGVPYPGIRKIDTWIDWLPYLQSIAENGDLREAKALDPYERTLNRMPPPAEPAARQAHLTNWRKKPCLTVPSLIRR